MPKFYAVLLPAKKAPLALIDNGISFTLNYNINEYVQEGEPRNHIFPRHLYLCTDDTPNDGDLVIPNKPNESIWTFKESPCPLPYWGNKHTCKKIIQSTDPSLGLPTISKNYINFYIKKHNQK